MVRNVLIGLGSGQISLYHHAPKDSDRGEVHRLGIESDAVDALVPDVKAMGYAFRRGMTDAGAFEDIMAAGAGGVSLELFPTRVLR